MSGSTTSRFSVSRRNHPRGLYRPLILCGLCAALSMSGHERAAAADAAGDDTPANAAVHHVAVDASVEATTRRSFSGTASVTGAPFGDLDASGLRLLIEGNYNLYRYTNSNPPPLMIDGRTVEPSALIGYEYDAETLTLAGYVGFDRQTTTATAPDPTNSTLGTKSGGALRVEASFTPTEGTTLEAAVDFATPNRAWRLDMKATRTLFAGVGLGPEIIAQGDAFYHQVGAGVHAEGFVFYGLTFGVGTGLVMDARQGPGLYGVLETERRF